MAKNNQRDPNLRAATVARVNELVKNGYTKAGAFEKISAETGRAKDAVQMLYYRAIRAAKSPRSGKASARPVAPKAAAPKAVAPKVAAPKAAAPKPVAAAPAPVAKPAVRRGRRPGRPAGRPAQSVLSSNDFPALLNGIANAINELLKQVEKTVEENKSLREQSQRLATIANLVRGR